MISQTIAYTAAQMQTLVAIREKDVYTSLEKQTISMFQQKKIRLIYKLRWLF